jgi:hypothetical protein
LFGICSPLAVIGRIAFVVFDSLDHSLFEWLTAHIGEEVFKRIKPTLVDRNTATAIVFIGLIPWITTAAFYMTPDNILWTISTLPTFLSMLRVCLAGNFIPEAPTGFRLPGAQVGKSNDLLRPAIAEA